MLELKMLLEAAEKQPDDFERMATLRSQKLQLEQKIAQLERRAEAAR